MFHALLNRTRTWIDVLPNDGGKACFPRTVSQFLNQRDESQHVKLRQIAVAQLATMEKAHVE